jgi:hypothetical protein
MALDTDEPQIPYEFQEAIVPYVTIMGLLKAKKYSDAAMKYSEYIIILQNLLDKYIRRIPARMTDIRLPDAVKVV